MKATVFSLSRKLFFVVIFVAFFLLSLPAAGETYDNIDVTDTVNIPASGSKMVYHAPVGTQLFYIGEPDLTGTNIYVFDSYTRELIHTVVVTGGIPMDLLTDLEGKQLFVALSASIGSMHTNGINGVVVFDTTDFSEVKRVAIGGNRYGPARIAISPNNKKIYLPHRYDGFVGVVDVDTLSFSNSIALPPTTKAAGPIGLDFTPDGLRAYVGSWYNQAVYEIDTQTEAVINTITLDFIAKNSIAISINSDGTRVYVTARGDNRIFVLDSDTASLTYNTVVGTIATDSYVLEKMYFDSAGTTLFVVSSGTNEILALDTDPTSISYHEFIKRIAIGGEPFDMTFHPTLEHVAFVSTRKDNGAPILAVPDEEHFAILVALDDDALFDVLNSAPLADLLAWHAALPPEYQSVLVDELSSEQMHLLLMEFENVDLLDWFGGLSSDALCKFFSNQLRKDREEVLSKMVSNDIHQLLVVLDPQVRFDTMDCVGKEARQRLLWFLGRDNRRDLFSRRDLWDLDFKRPSVTWKHFEEDGKKTIIISRYRPTRKIDRTIIIEGDTKTVTKNTYWFTDGSETEDSWENPNWGFTNNLPHKLKMALEKLSEKKQGVQSKNCKNWKEKMKGNYSDDEYDVAEDADEAEYDAIGDEE